MDCPARPATSRFAWPHAPRAAVAALVAALAAPLAQAEGGSALAPGMLDDLQAWTQQRVGQAQPRPGANIKVEVGQLDPRLRLAPCRQIEPYLPPGSRPWGRTRVGLRCADGPVAWNVFLPVTVRVMAPAPVLREPLPAGTELRDDHFTDAEVDWAEAADAPLADRHALVGQLLARPMAAGAALRANDLRKREWFAAGDRVRVIAVGPGFRVSAEGTALGRGLDGQSARVRIENGRIVSGTAVGERQVEMAL